MGEEEMKMPKGYAEPLSLEALAEGVYRCHDNVERLANEAELLLSNRFFPGCINACRLAVEELAKSHLLTQGATNTGSDTATWKWIWSSFADHKEKLRIIEYEIHWPKHQDVKTFHDNVRTLRDLREESLYVQFDAARKAFYGPEEVLAKYGGAEAEAHRQIGYLRLLMLFFFPTGRPSKDELLAGFKEIRRCFQ